MNNRIKEAIVLFPSEFGLSSFPSERFRISEWASYINDKNEVMIYLDRKMPDDTWLNFAKGTIEEVKKYLTK